MSERVVDKLMQNDKEDTFTILFANGAQRTCKGDQLMPPLDRNDHIWDMVRSLRDDMRDMYYANMTQLWIDDGEDHDATLHSNYQNYYKVVGDLKDSLKQSEGNHLFLTEIKNILKKQPQDGNKQAAEDEIKRFIDENKMNKVFTLVMEPLVQAEVRDIVSNHFNVGQNGSVVDLVVQEVAQGDLTKLKDAFGLDDEAFSAIHAQVDHMHVEWANKVRNSLNLKMSLNLANPETVEVLVGLSIQKINGNQIDLPHLKDEPEINSYSLQDIKDDGSDMGNLKFNFKVIHSNLLAFSTQCIV